MIRVPIVLDSWGLGVKHTTLGTLEIVNDGTGSRLRGNYNVSARGKRNKLLRSARVENWPRTSKPPFALVSAALLALGY
jgi:hypothetical protein